MTSTALNVSGDQDNYNPNSGNVGAFFKFE